MNLLQYLKPKAAENTTRTPFAVDVTVSLHTDNPRWNTNTEVRDPAYQRQSATITEAGNVDEINFAQATESYVATHVALHDGRGVIFDVKDLSTSKLLRPGDRITLPAASLELDYVAAAIATNA